MLCKHNPLNLVCCEDVQNGSLHSERSNQHSCIAGMCIVNCYGTIHIHICTSLYDGVRHQVYTKYMYTHKTMFGVVEYVNSRLIQTLKHHNTYSPPSFHIPFST